MTMRQCAGEVEDVERCRRARRTLEHRFKTLDGLYAYFLSLQRKRGRNVARGQRLLAARDAARAKALPASRRRRTSPTARRSA